MTFLTRAVSLTRHALVGQLLRFAVVGATTGVIYAIVTWGCSRWLGTSPTLSSVIGYLAVLPLSFAGHRNVTFRSNGSLTAEFWRFCLSFGLGLLASGSVMWIATEWLGLTVWHGIAAAIVGVPIITFLVMNIWVFQTQSKHGRNHGHS